MTILLVLSILLAVLIVGLLVVCVLLMRENGNRELAKYTAGEHARNLDLGGLLLNLTKEFATALTDAAGRESEDIRLVLDSLIADRRFMLTAALAASDDPQASQRLGAVTRALEQTERARGREDLERDLMARHASEFTDSDGTVIVPVGMAGS